MKLSIEGTGLSAIVGLSEKEPKQIAGEIKDNYLTIFNLDNVESFIAIKKNFYHLKDNCGNEIITTPSIDISHMPVLEEKVSESFNIPKSFYNSVFKTAKNILLLEEEVTGTLGYIEILDSYKRLIPLYTKGFNSILDMEFLVGFLVDGKEIPIETSWYEINTNSTKKYLTINETLIMDI